MPAFNHQKFCTTYGVIPETYLANEECDQSLLLWY